MVAFLASFVVATDAVVIADKTLGNLQYTEGFKMTGGGRAVSIAGDVNGDGVGDIIIGSSWTNSNAGITFVVFGKKNSVNSDITLTGFVTGPTTGFRIFPANAGDANGWSVSTAGDVNGDGVDDILTASREADVGARLHAGIVYVIFGRKVTAASNNAFADIQLTNGELAAHEGFRILGSASNDNNGDSLSNAGDMNGDGIDDFMVGAQQADPAGLGGDNNAGIAYVIFGKNMTGLTSAFGDVDLQDIVTGNPKGFRIMGAASLDYLCRSMSLVGDVNGDGIGDIAIGANQADAPGVGTNNNAGIAYVIFGRNASTFGDIALSGNPLAANVGFRILGAAIDDRTGSAINAAGDVNNDGIDDMMVGVVGADPAALGANSDGGMVFVIYGRNIKGGADPFPDIFLVSITTGSLIGFRIVGAELNSGLGLAISDAGDVNSDGVDDIIVGAQNSFWQTGVTYVVYGRKAVGGLNPFDNVHLSMFNSNVGFRIYGEAANDLSGSTVSGGADLNGDSIPDIIIGTPLGSSYVIYGTPNTPTSQPSSQPSNQPSVQPSKQPSALPSGQPSTRPSLQPSHQPSSQPSGKPSAQPGAQPTTQPTRQPSSQPTSQLTNNPSAQPSAQPSKQPTSQPTNAPSAQLSLQPSGQPSAQPTQQPSTAPSGQPSSQPSRQPSSQPSGQPSSQPSSQPSPQLSRQPSMQPSSQPLAQPSTQPSPQPSRLPTLQPTTVPSDQPSNQPSDQPSQLPTTQPSSQPSVQPSVQPTTQPSAQPTSLPSEQPTSKPSEHPSMQPSKQPSSQPSASPTAQPSKQPRSTPTAQPFAKPSAAPSVTPSTVPSAQPATQPSTQPSTSPSMQPSAQPSAALSVQPSAQPSAQPSKLPSGQPTIIPSAQPSIQPTSQPRDAPIRQPSSQPSRQPQASPTSDPTTPPTNTATGNSDTRSWVTPIKSSQTINHVGAFSSDVWVCGKEIDAACTTLDSANGLARMRFRFPWAEATSALQSADLSRIVVSGRTGTTQGTVNSDVASCSPEQILQLSCMAKTFYDIDLTASGLVPFANKLLHIGMWNALVVASVIDVSGTSTSVFNAQHFAYTFKSMQSVTIFHVLCPPVYVGGFFAGTGVSNTASANYIVAGVVRTDSGTMTAMYFKPAIGSILNSVELVKAMALEYEHPDSFIAGGLQLSDNAGLHAYLMRVNTFFGSVKYTVRYVASYSGVPGGARRAVSALADYPRVARGIVRVGNAIYMILDLSKSNNVSCASWTVLKIDMVTGLILQQVHVSSPSACLSCTGITTSTDSVSLFIACVVQYNASYSEAMVIATDVMLSFAKLPVGVSRHTESLIVEEFIPFQRIALPVTSKRTDIASSDYVYATTEAGTPTMPPFAAPTIVPSMQPSSAPSGQPSSGPTAAPSISPQPTSHPSTGGPTNTYKPTVKPTQRPSREPTVGPTVQPTRKPTTEPTARPSFKPSPVPSTQSSLLNTVTPTHVPTPKPTRNPSRLPSATPSHAPTVVVVSAAVGRAGKKSDDAVMIFLYVLVSVIGAWCMYQLLKCTAQSHHDTQKRKAIRAELEDLKFTLPEPLEHPTDIRVRKKRPMGAHATGAVVDVTAREDADVCCEHRQGAYAVARFETADIPAVVGGSDGSSSILVSSLHSSEMSDWSSMGHVDERDANQTNFNKPDYPKSKVNIMEEGGRSGYVANIPYSSASSLDNVSAGRSVDA